MTCKKCGASIKTNAKFCTSCGAPAASGTEQPIQKGRDLRRWLSWGLVSAGMLGLIFVILLNIKPDRQEKAVARDTPKVAAPEKSNGNALFLLGLKHLKESKDYKKAMECFRGAAEQGHVNAQYNVGVMYERGKGITQDYKEALKWYHKAAEQGNVNAQYNTGIIYFNGKGVPQDYKEAFKWFHKAAEQGYANAQYNIGVMYERGKGINQDYEEALKWYHKAAGQGKAKAQHNMGNMYANGLGVPQDNKKAEKWFLMAAKQGFELSKKKLESMRSKASSPLPSTDKVKPLDSALKYSEYKNTKYNFKALLPSTWESEVKGSAIIFSGAKNTDQFSTTINFQVIPRTSKTSLEGQAQKIREQWANMKNFKLLSQETVNLTGKPAVHMLASFTVASVNKIYNQEQVIIEHTNHHYFIAYTAPEALFNKYRYIMNKTVESFQFLK